MLCDLCMSVCRFAVSNAFERSRGIATVLFFIFIYYYFFFVKALGDYVVYFM